MTPGNTTPETFEPDIFRALDIVRGEVEASTGSLLVLSTYGIKTLADPTYPNQEIQQEATRAWEHLLQSESASATLDLARATARIFRRVISHKDHQRFNDPEALAAELIAPSFGTGSENNDGAISKLIRFVQQLQRFQSVEQRKAFSNALLARTIDSTNRDTGYYSRIEQTSSTVIAEVIATLAQHWALNTPKTTYDLAVGTGQTLLQATKAFTQDGATPPVTFYGQDIDHSALLRAGWRLLLNDASKVHLRPGDVLLEPAFLGNANRLQRFDLVTSTPPLNLRLTRKIDLAKLENDPHNRFQFGPTPRNSSDWLFVQHALASTNPEGVAIISMTPGALFRRGLEATVRRALITADHVSAALLLPSGLVPGTSIQAALLVLEPRKPAARQGTVNLIDLTDAPDEDLVATLREELINPGTGRSSIVTVDELREHDYSLLPTPYLPPREIRSTLLPREAAQAQLNQALKDLTDSAVRFKTLFDPELLL